MVLSSALCFLSLHGLTLTCSMSAGMGELPSLKGFTIDVKRRQRFNPVLRTCEGLAPGLYRVSARPGLSPHNNLLECWEIGASPVPKVMS